MTTQDIDKVLESVGMDQLLFDAQLTEVDVLELLYQQGYMNLEGYLEDE